MGSNGEGHSSEVKKIQKEDAVECILSAEKDKDYFR